MAEVISETQQTWHRGPSSSRPVVNHQLHAAAGSSGHPVQAYMVIEGLSAGLESTSVASLSPLAHPAGHVQSHVSLGTVHKA